MKVLIAFLLAVAAYAQCPAIGTYSLTNVNSGLTLSVAGQVTGNGGALLQWQWQSGRHQQWDLAPLSGLYVGLSNGLVAIYRCTLGVSYKVWVAPQYADGEVPAGTVNGANRVFTLAYTPTAPPMIVFNGLLLKQGTDYTWQGNTITFVAGVAIPQTAQDLLQAWYRH